jgi:C4-dicarboxylate transporter/malic acid transport protein
MSIDEERQQSGSPGSGGSSKVGFRQRIEHFTWANFTCTQSTGGIAILISQTSYQFTGQQTAGTVIFIFNLVVFALFCLAMLTRFILHPYTIKKSLTAAPEAFFLGSFWVSMATIIICMQRFGVPHTGPWLIVAIRVLFWMYSAVTLLYTVVKFVIAFTEVAIDLEKISPAVFLMVYNTMLTGTVAASIAASQPPHHRMPIIVAGIAHQGLGWIGSMLLMPWFLGGLFIHGTGNPSQRPGLWMPVGAGGYTILTLIGCARALPADYGYFAAHPMAIEVLQIMALWVAIFLWLFTFWFFAMALVANIPAWIPKFGRRKHPAPRTAFTLSWWTMVFPNLGYVIGTMFIGEELQSPAIEWVGEIAAIIMIAVWLLDLVLHLRAILIGQIMWPGKDEDANK